MGEYAHLIYLQYTSRCTEGLGLGTFVSQAQHIQDNAFIDTLFGDKYCKIDKHYMYLHNTREQINLIGCCK